MSDKKDRKKTERIPDEANGDVFRDKMSAAKLLYGILSGLQGIKWKIIELQEK